MEYRKKIDFAIKLLRSIPQSGNQPIEVCYSGGKDSDVILRLAQMSGIKYEAVYKNTTIDPPGTIAHCREVGATILNPKKSFLQLVAEKGLPTRRARFCCEVLKEYKVYDCAILGIRRSESAARKTRYKEPEICRIYPHKERVRQYLPILYWTNEDIARFIEEQSIKCSPVYYDDDGNFHIERRLGCIGCPLQADNGVSDYVKYPLLLKKVIRQAQIFIDNHPESATRKKFNDANRVVFHNLFCDTYDDFCSIVRGGYVPRISGRCERLS